MSIEFVEAHNFRLFNQLSLDLDHGINVIYGDNASGKTSLLESIHYLCSCKSFLAASPRKLIKKNSVEFFVRGRIKVDESRSQTISIAWQDQKVHLKHGLENIYKLSIQYFGVILSLQICLYYTSFFRYKSLPVSELYAHHV